MKIGEKIRRIREMKGLKQENIATEMGMSVTAYGNLERGDTNLTFDKLEQIAGIFEMSVQDIVNMPDELTINNFSSNMGVQFSANYGSVTAPEIEAYKMTIVELQKQVEHLKAQNDKLTDALIKKQKQ